MVTVVQTENFITDQLARSLSSEGFRKVSAFLLTRESQQGVVWQIRCGARKDKASNRMLVGLSAAIRFESVAAFLQSDTQERHSPTFTVPIHFLHDDCTLLEWDAEKAETIPAMLIEVKQYALPFFKHYEKLENLLAALESDDPRKWLSVSRNVRPELVASILAVLGKHAEAIGWVDRELEARRAKPVGHRIGLQRLRQRLLAA